MDDDTTNRPTYGRWRQHNDMAAFRYGSCILCICYLCSLSVQAQRLVPGNFTTFSKDSLYLGILHINVDSLRVRAEISDSLKSLANNTSYKILPAAIKAGTLGQVIKTTAGGLVAWAADSAGGRNVFLFDAGYPVIRIDSNLTRTNYNLLYMAQEFTRSNGAISSFANGASDSNRITFDANTAWILPPGQVVNQIVLLSSKVGSTSQSITLLGVYEHPGIGSNDSTVVACKVVSRGGQYYLTFSKFYIPGLANPFSTTNTGGTNFLEVQISSALFPSTGTVVSLKVAILTGRKRY